jgi:hypothetical protein
MTALYDIRKAYHEIKGKVENYVMLGQVKGAALSKKP